MRTERPKLDFGISADSKGATNRRKIMIYLKNNLANANQLANHFNIDYKGIRFHLRILEDNNLVRDSGYGYNYFVAPYFEINEEVFWEINAMMERGRKSSVEFMRKFNIVFKIRQKILHKNKSDHTKVECPICNREIHPYWETKYGGLRATCHICEANWAESYNMELHHRGEK